MPPSLKIQLQTSIHRRDPYLGYSLLVLGAVLSFSFSSAIGFCQDSSPGRETNAGDIFVSASIGEPSNLIPILATDSASQDVVGKVFNGLLRYNPDLELEGDLAEKWEVLDEGKTLIFHLRKNVLWHDLQPFTAADVEFTYLKLIDPDIPTPFGGDFTIVKRLEVLDPFTVRVEYEQPFSPALSSWTMWIMPKHLMEHEDLLQSSFTRSPIGTGPFQFKRWLDGNRVELVVFDRYFERRPKLRGVIYRVIPDQTTMFLELHQQTIDMMGLTPLQYLRLTDSSYFEKEFRKFRYPSLGYVYLGYNLKKDLFQDKKVRQALDLAVNKQEIIDGVLMGLGRVCTGPFTPESWAHNAAVRSHSYDPEKALRLLHQQGWADTDKDGILDKGGRPFEFTITTNQGNFQRQLSAEIIQKRLKDIGISVKIKIIEWSAFIKEFIDKRQFDAVLLGWGLSLDPDPYDIWHSSKTRQGEFNFISYENQRVDALIEKGRRTFDMNARKDAYHEMHSIVYEEQPVMFLYISDSLPIIHRRFKNVRATPLGLGYNFIDWEVPSSEHKYSRYLL